MKAKGLMVPGEAVVVVEEDRGLGVTLLEKVKEKQGFAGPDAPDAITNRLIVVAKLGRSIKTPAACAAIGGTFQCRLVWCVPVPRTIWAGVVVRCD
jgi:hypothetical protein